MRLDLTRDEVDLLMRLCSGCDDMEGDDQAVAMRLDRHLSRLLALAAPLETCATKPGCPARGCDECGNARPSCKQGRRKEA